MKGMGLFFKRTSEENKLGKGWLKKAGSGTFMTHLKLDIAKIEKLIEEAKLIGEKEIRIVTIKRKAKEPGSNSSHLVFKDKSLYDISSDPNLVF